MARQEGEGEGESESESESDALNRLAELLRVDVSSLEDEELVSGAQRAEAIVRGGVAESASGRLLAELYRRGHSWSDLVRLTGLSQGTIWRRTQPYL